MEKWKWPVATLGVCASGVLGFAYLHATAVEWLLLAPAFISFMTVLVMDVFRWRQHAWARVFVVLYIILLALIHTMFIPLVLYILHPSLHKNVVAQHPYTVAIVFMAVDVLCLLIPLVKAADKEVLSVFKAVTDSLNLIILVIALLVTQSSTGLWILTICLGPISMALRIAEAWIVLRGSEQTTNHKTEKQTGRD